MKNLLPILLFTLLLSSCSEEKKPKITYAEEEQPTEISEDSTRSLMSDLPIQIDSTNYLIHPVGEFQSYEGSSSGYSGLSGSSFDSFTLTYQSNADIFTGDLNNLKFQHIESDSLTTLTNKNLRISSVTFLRAIFENTGKEYLLYSVVDSDSNNDGKINYKDISTFYISTINGREFRKISPVNQEVLNWSLIPTMSRLYFRSIEDSNRNGKFEKEDRVHYFYIDFDTEELQVEGYFPV